MTNSNIATNIWAPRRLNLKKTLRLCITLDRERRQLKKLGAHLLKDIGMSEDEAHRESSRPFWHIPGNR